MKHVAAFQPQVATAGLSEDEWDRLPWLFDEPKLVRRGRTGIALAVLLFLTADALASYTAGRFSADWSGFSTPPVDSSELVHPIREPALSAQNVSAFAQRM